MSLLQMTALGVTDVVEQQNSALAGASQTALNGTAGVGGSATTVFTYSFWVMLPAALSGRSGDDGATNFLIWASTVNGNGRVTISVDGLGNAGHAAIRAWTNTTTLVMRVDLGVPYDGKWHLVHVTYNGGWSVSVDGAAKSLAVNTAISSSLQDHIRNTGSGRVAGYAWRATAKIGPMHVFARAIAHTALIDGEYPWPQATHKDYAGGGWLPGEYMINWTSPNIEDDKSPNAYNFLLS